MKKIPREPREPSEISPKIFKIPIDPATIKKPENSTPVELYVTAVGVQIPEEGYLRLVGSTGNYDSHGTGNTQYQYMAAGSATQMQELIKKLQLTYGTSRIRYNIRALDYSNTWGNWLSGVEYDYIPTEVSCGLCKSKFLHTKLNGRCDCPICGVQECCVLQYEQYNVSQIDPALVVG